MGACHLLPYPGHGLLEHKRVNVRANPLEVLVEFHRHH